MESITFIVQNGQQKTSFTLKPGGRTLSEMVAFTPFDAPTTRVTKMKRNHDFFSFKTVFDYFEPLPNCSVQRADMMARYLFLQQELKTYERVAVSTPDLYVAFASAIMDEMVRLLLDIKESD